MPNSMVIIGTRQAGKTHIAVAMAVETAAAGGQVLFQGTNQPADHARFLDCVDRAEYMFPDKIQRVYRTNYEERILFKNGGRLCFSDKAYDYFAEIDLHVIDDVANADARPNALRSIKTVTI